MTLRNALILTAVSTVLTAANLPKTRIVDVKETLHGVELTDPYRWLEDQKAPETRAWIGEQNRYTRSKLDALPGRDALSKRLGELLKVDTVNVPSERHGRYFFSKRLAGQEQFVLYTREGPRGKDEVLLDPHPLSPDRTTSVRISGISDDGAIAAIGRQQGGEDEVSIMLLDVETKKDLGDALPKGRYTSISFKPDKSGFYYGRYGASGPRIYYHARGTDHARDPVLFGEGRGATEIAFPSISEDGRYLLIHVIHGSSADKTEIYIQDLASGGPLKPIVNDVSARFLGEIGGDQLFVHTNWNAPNGRVLAVDLKKPDRANWREIVPEGKSVLEEMTTAGGHLFVHYLENVTSRMKVFTHAGKYVREVKFPALGSVKSVSGRWESNQVFLQFASFHVPPTIYLYDVAKGGQEVWAKPEAPIDSSQLEVRQEWYTSKDGTKVPMFLLHRKGIQLDGQRPVMLTGYGGFALSNTPGFSATAALWAERGGVFALANLRGGLEFGEEWHKAGMRANKQNVFDDFIAAAEWLIANKYTKPERLAITGGSNGGLLVGAAITQRPELFGAVICRYPLLDMIRYHKFLVARFWVPEYGSSDDAEQFRYLRAYSPYHQVKSGVKYPPLLMVTGDGDTRVDPLHGRKMTAMLQAKTGSDKPILLLYDEKAGHSSGMPVSKQIEVATDELSFLYWQLGVGDRR
ncbi:MAG: prolyl oligopeptidase family serine peptidase [Bryobacteraceae bacterium]